MVPQREFIRQIQVLAWKNYQIKLRNWVALGLEVIVPLVVVIALGGVKIGIGSTTNSAVVPENYRHGTTIESLFGKDAPLCTDMNLVYSCLRPNSCLNVKDYAAGAWLTRCKNRKIAVMTDTSDNDGGKARRSR